MDSDTSFLLKIHLLGNPKTTRKDIRCFDIEMVVDSDLSNYKDLVESVTEKYPPGYLEVAHVQYYDNVIKDFPEINSDQDLISMFDLHCKEKVVEMFFTYCDPSEVFVPITEWKFNNEAPPEEQGEVEYLRNPLPENEHGGVDEETMYLDIDEPVCSEKGLELVHVNVKDDSEDGEDGGDEESEDVEDPLEEEEEPYE
jgi:hypothetical protein